MQSVRGAIEVRSKCAYGRPMVCALRAQLDGVQLFVMSFPAPRFRNTPGLDERVRQEADRRHDNSIACQMTGFVVVVGQDVVVRKAHDSSFPPRVGGGGTGLRASIAAVEAERMAAHGIELGDHGNGESRVPQREARPPPWDPDDSLELQLATQHTAERWVAWYSRVPCEQLNLIAQGPRPRLNLTLPRVCDACGRRGWWPRCASNRPSWRPEVSLDVVRCHLGRAGGAARYCGWANPPHLSGPPPSSQRNDPSRYSGMRRRAIRTSVAATVTPPPDVVPGALLRSDSCTRGSHDPSRGSISSSWKRRWRAPARGR